MAGHRRGGWPRRAPCRTDRGTAQSSQQSVSPYGVGPALQFEQLRAAANRFQQWPPTPPQERVATSASTHAVLHGEQVTALTRFTKTDPPKPTPVPGRVRPPARQARSIWNGPHPTPPYKEGIRAASAHHPNPGCERPVGRVLDVGNRASKPPESGLPACSDALEKSRHVGSAVNLIQHRTAC